MKIRESGMPPAKLWNSFFDAEKILRQLNLTNACHDIVEFGCGYGTFTIPSARIISGRVYSLEIDPDMIASTAEQVTESGISNVELIHRDFIAAGSGLPDGVMDYAMVFNILHHDNPVGLLREAYRNLGDDGHLGIIHWNFDSDTPRGPPMEIRPRPEQCQQWALKAGFEVESEVIALPPFHYGIIFVKKTGALSESGATKSD